MTQALPGWIHAWQKNISPEQKPAWDYLCETGLPKQAEERWRYANLQFLHQHDFVVGGPGQFGASEREFILSKRKEGYFLLVFANGRWYWDFPDNDFSHIARLTRVDVRGMSVDPQAAFPLMHGLLCEEILSISVLENQQLKLQCCYFSNEPLKMNAPHYVVTQRAGSQCSLLEESFCGAHNLILSRVQFNLKDNTRCYYTKLDANQDVFLWQWTEIFQSANSFFQSLHWVKNISFMRHELNVDLQAQRAICSVNGFSSLIQSSQYVDHHVDVLHRASHTDSEMLFKGIVNAPARSVFNGRLCVLEDVSAIQAYQGNHHLLLNTQGEVRSKPELEIYAKDVRCKHGSSTGALDEEALFYLRARGLPEAEAKAMLMHGFSKELMEKISDTQIQQTIQKVFYEAEFI